MSRQLKDLQIYPITDNTVKTINDQVDYESEDNINKILIRTPDHYPLDVDTSHTHAKDGYGKIAEVIATDPLSVVTSGYADIDLSGYDGLITSDDGYTRARGVVRTNTYDEKHLINPAYCVKW